MPRAVSRLLAASLVALLAALLTACGDDDEGAGVKALPSATCGELEYGGEGEPDALVASDLPMRGASRERSEQMVEAIRVVLEQSDWTAGEIATRVPGLRRLDRRGRGSGTRPPAAATRAPTPPTPT